ncbi:MAG: hypothetical protein Q7R88_02975, partial [bacterium]|nr:hypothetical protein [bacterium]
MLRRTVKLCAVGASVLVMLFSVAHAQMAPSAGTLGTNNFSGFSSSFDFSLGNSGNLTTTRGTTVSNTITATWLSGNFFGHIRTALSYQIHNSAGSNVTSSGGISGTWN